MICKDLGGFTLLVSKLQQEKTLKSFCALFRRIGDSVCFRLF